MRSISGTVRFCWCSALRARRAIGPRARKPLGRNGTRATVFATSDYPRAVVTPAYLRAALRDLMDDHVVNQRDYHRAKAKRLTSVHRNLDKVSELSFQLAVVSVATFLTLSAATLLGLMPDEALYKSTKTFTFLAVVLPTFGAAIAGIRYFGDFERFANISEVTAEKLDAVHKRIELLLTAPDGQLTYGRVAELAHATDDVVNSEIESWQAVFGGKHITVPV